MHMAELFSVCSGTCIGAEHIGTGGVLSSGNNQDSCAYHIDPEFVAAVVCDGCSDRAESGVGANLLARLFIDAVAGCRSFIERDFVARVNDQLLHKLNILSRLIGGSYKSPSQVADEIFLSTLVGAVMTPESTIVVACGDGMWGINGRVDTLGPFDSNEPPYLGYQIRDGRDARRDLAVVTQTPTASVDSLFLGSDGCAHLKGQIHSFLGDKRYFRNPVLLSRDLRTLNQEKLSLGVEQEQAKQSVTVRPSWTGRELPDDTTMVIINRKPKPVASSELLGADVGYGNPLPQGPKEGEAPPAGGARPRAGRSWFDSFQRIGDPDATESE